MDLQLSGKTALVTGSTAGIGHAIATALVREGAHVVINGRTQARVDEATKRMAEVLGADILTKPGQSPTHRTHKVAQDSTKCGGSVSGVAADLATAEGFAGLMKAVPEVDILVNNLGIFEPKAFLEITDADWTKFFEGNVMSGVRGSRFYLPKMMEKQWGRIVFISSESGVNTPTEMIHYGLTKTAQLALSRGLAQVAAGTGVTVNTVMPGPTKSEGVGVFVGQMAKEKGISAEQMEKDFFEHARPSSLLKRFETVEEIADVVAFVCSPLAAAVTGAAWRADGGVVASIV